MRVIFISAAAAALLVSAGQAMAQQVDLPAAQAAGLRLLTWPGKTTPQGRLRRAPEPEATRPPAYDAPPRAVAPANGVFAPGSAPAEVRKAELPPPAQRPMSAPTTGPAALPTSIYAPAPPPARMTAAQPVVQRQAAPAPASAAESDYTTPRFYSLHRAYGLKPDPIPLSPQFFSTPTPDLAEPPPPPPRTVFTTNGEVVHAMNNTAPSAN